MVPPISTDFQAQKHRSSRLNNMVTNARKLAQACQKEQRRSAIQSQRQCKETPYRARRLTREMMAYWKHYDKVEREHRKRAEKEAQEQRRLDDEIREVSGCYFLWQGGPKYVGIIIFNLKNTGFLNL